MQKYQYFQVFLGRRRTLTSWRSLVRVQYRPLGFYRVFLTTAPLKLMIDPFGRPFSEAKACQESQSHTIAKPPSGGSARSTGRESPSVQTKRRLTTNSMS